MSKDQGNKIGRILAGFLRAVGFTPAVRLTESLFRQNTAGMNPAARLDSFINLSTSPVSFRRPFSP